VNAKKSPQRGNRSTTNDSDLLGPLLPSPY
jgi:hypothetical protein